MKKIIFVTVLIFCLLSGTELAYSYFEESNDIVLDHENQLYTLDETFSSANQKLIPVGSVLKEMDTYYLVFKYEVIVEENMDLAASIENLSLNDNISNLAYLSDVFTFDISFDHVENIQIGQGLFQDGKTAEKIEITVTISMNDIQDTQYYKDIYNSFLSYSLLLRVSKP